MKYEKLTVRETDVIKLLVEGFTNKQIATILQISIFTVMTYIENIYSKFMVNPKRNSRIQAAVIAIKEELI